MPEGTSALRNARIGLALALALVVWLGAATTVGASTLTPAITVTVNHARVTGSKPVVLSGKVTGEVNPVEVDLYRNAYPYNQAQLVARTTTHSNGIYSFTATPYRNTRYRVKVRGTSAQR